MWKKNIKPFCDEEFVLSTLISLAETGFTKSSITILSSSTANKSTEIHQLQLIYTSYVFSLSNNWIYVEEKY